MTRLLLLALAAAAIALLLRSRPVANSGHWADEGGGWDNLDTLRGSRSLDSPGFDEWRL